MKKLYLGIVALLVVFSLVTLGVKFWMASSSDELVKALEQVDEAVAAGGERDLTAAMATLEGKSERAITADTAFATGYRAAQGKGCAVVGVLAVELLRQGRITEEIAGDVVAAVLVQDPVNSAWLPEDKAHVAAMLATQDQERLALALSMAIVDENDMELKSVLLGAAERLTPEQLAEVSRLRSEHGLLPIQ